MGFWEADHRGKVPLSSHPIKGTYCPASQNWLAPSSSLAPRVATLSSPFEAAPLPPGLPQSQGSWTAVPRQGPGLPSPRLTSAFLFSPRSSPSQPPPDPQLDRRGQGHTGGTGGPHPGWIWAQVWSGESLPLGSWGVLGVSGVLGQGPLLLCQQGGSLISLCLFCQT